MIKKEVKPSVYVDAGRHAAYMDCVIQSLDYAGYDFRVIVGVLQLLQEETNGILESEYITLSIKEFKKDLPRIGDD